MNEKQWYVLYTRPRHEKKLVLLLSRAGLTLYLPLKRLKKKWSDRVKMVEEPLFKSYIFLNIDYRKERFDALRFLGAIKFVMFEGKPAVIDPEIIQSLRILEAQAASLESVPATGFEAGDEVLITQGPFKGVRAHVERRKNLNRIVIKMPLLNQIVYADVDAWDLEKQ